VVSEDEALLQLLSELKALGYQFTTVTPATHSRVLSRAIDGEPSLHDIFGWNRPFAPGQLDRCLLHLLEAADALEQCGTGLRSKLRVASLDRTLFLHSSFPTDKSDSVFFGPDTYRFVRFVSERIKALPTPARLIDMGAGSGAGGIAIARSSACTSVALVDRNPEALRLAAVNASHADVRVHCIAAETVPPGADLVIANPPYMMDSARRTYRDGGDLLGGEVAHDWVVQSLSAMEPRGTMLLYTGAAYHRGSAPLVETLFDTCRNACASFELEELDPDVFGDELDTTAYSAVDRIAIIGALITKRG
jgi:methylase of polypeptide subunit release factors